MDDIGINMNNGIDYGESSGRSMNNHDVVNEKEARKQASKAQEYIRELLAEKLSLDPNKYQHVCRLLDKEIAKVQASGKSYSSSKEAKYVDIYRERPIKVSVKVLVPVREHPKFNFVGKLLGPKGNSMKRLQEETMCKMAVLGRGSMKDRQKEEELRNSLDPKYAHLSDDLHVEISALGPPAEAHARIAFALAEVRKYLIPDNNDNIRQEQMREMEIMSSEERDSERDSLSRNSSRGRSCNNSSSNSGSGGGGILRGSRGSLPMRTATRTPVIAPRVMPAKTKIMSILDRARIAMEESYGYEEPYEPTDPSFDYYPTSTSLSHSRGSSSYNTQQYDDDDEDFEDPVYYRESTVVYEPSNHRRWSKSSSYKSNSSMVSESNSRHLESSSSSSRYRTSPYTRPSK